MKKAREEGVAPMPKQRPRSIPSLQVTLEEGVNARRRPSKRNKDEEDDYEELTHELWDRGRASMRRLVYQSVQKPEQDQKGRIVGWKQKEISKSSPLLDVSMVTKGLAGANVALQRSPRKRPKLPGISSGRGHEEESSADEAEDEEGTKVEKSHRGMKLDIGKRRLQVAGQAGGRGDSSSSSDEEDGRERGPKTSRERHGPVTKSYSMYHSSLLQQQQRLNGLLSPRLPRKSYVTPYPTITFLVLITPILSMGIDAGMIRRRWKGTCSLLWEGIHRDLTSISG